MRAVQTENGGYMTEYRSEDIGQSFVVKKTVTGML